MDAAVNFPTTPKAVKAAPLTLHKRMSVEQAFDAIVRSCIDQIRANADGVGPFQDSESVHQMRVGLRRLGAALAMFDGLVHPPDGIKAELAWLMDQLAPARDWDVLLASTLHQVEAAVPDCAALAALRRAVHDKRVAAYASAADAVSSPRCRQLGRALDEWLERRGWREGLSPKGKTRLKMRAVDLAGAILEKEQQRLRKRGRKLDEATDEVRHRVRVAAKRTRYAAEFFASFYPGKRVRPYVAAMSDLQTALGELNDFAVARRLLGELGAGDDALREGVALVTGYVAATGRHGEPAARKLWRKLPPLHC
jgi:triphosphatase